MKKSNKKMKKAKAMGMKIFLGALCVLMVGSMFLPYLGILIGEWYG